MKCFCEPSFLLFGIFVLLVGPTCQFENKYSKEANVNYREVKDPYRMSKINMVWHKAIHKLTETKLKSLYTDLMAQDKDEIKLKRLKSDGLDKDGLQEAAVRKKFKQILTTYGLLEHFVDGTIPEKHMKSDDRSENHINKRIFKDKKLAKLWEKAERSGFDEKELKLLKEEFIHHQDKVDEYYNLLEKTDDKPANFLEPLDELEHMDHIDKSILPSQKYPDGGFPNVNQIRTKHRDIKDGYDSLHQKVASGPDSQEFSEPRVANLWNIALNADFSQDELNSLREELKHYEKRVEKLQHLQSEFLVKKIHSGKDTDIDKEHLHTDKDYNSLYADKIKRHERTVEKLHLELETKILNRHNEL